jgi:hypothetical protein
MLATVMQNAYASQRQATAPDRGTKGVTHE